MQQKEKEGERIDKDVKHLPSDLCNASVAHFQVYIMVANAFQHIKCSSHCQLFCNTCLQQQTWLSCTCVSSAMFPGQHIPLY